MQGHVAVRISFGITLKDFQNKSLNILRSVLRHATYPLTFHSTNNEGLLHADGK
jgi:hypothetical protein